MKERWCFDPKIGRRASPMGGALAQGELGDPHAAVDSIFSQAE